jgi:Rps23 Pro-64 3,4-dihydroxylase Tpa1-like proline 4-hydroxylase
VATDTANSSSSAHRGQRRLTFVYYLNDSSGGEGAGGELRLHDVPRRLSSADPESHLDVAPTLGTLVVFRR